MTLIFLHFNRLMTSLDFIFKLITLLFAFGRERLDPYIHSYHVPTNVGQSALIGDTI